MVHRSVDNHLQRTVAINPTFAGIMKNIFTYQNLDQTIEELFKREEERFKQLIRNSFDMIVLLDAEGNQQYVSESCERILGYSQDELMNIPVIEEMIHPDDKSKVQEGFRDILEYRANGGAQYRHRHKNGSWVYLEAFGSNQLENPLIQSIILNVRDITDRKEAEEALKESEAQLRELNATKDRFFSIIGHDLRGSFMGIQGFSEILVDQIRDKDYEGVEEYASMIQQSAKKAFDLFTNLLDWSQAQTGRMSFNRTAFDLVKVIDEVIDLFNETAHQKSITLRKKVPTRVPVLADRPMMQTILRNLVSNAIKFTETGGSIEINVEKGEKELQVAVSDTGVGIDPHKIDNLFCIEHAQSTEGTNNETGTGLGLLLCKEFVERHAGTIRAEPLPAGSRFVFTLPHM